MAEQQKNTKAGRRNGPVPEGYRRVAIVYNKDNTRHGEVVDLPADEARHLARENRVRYVDPNTPLGMPGDGDDQAGGAGLTATSVTVPAAGASAIIAGK